MKVCNKIAILIVKRKWFRNLLPLLMLLHLAPLTAQTDSTKSAFQKEFDAFKEASQEEFERFRNSNDSIFHQFLLESWESFQLLIDEKPPAPKPREIPEFDEKDLKPMEIIPMNYNPKRGSNDSKSEGSPELFDEYHAVEPKSTIDFYGSKIPIHQVRVKELSGNKASEEQVASFFKRAVADEELVYCFYDLLSKSKHHNLNGWGFLRLLQEASGSYFRSMNDRVLLTWTALVKTGHDARVGYTDNDIYLLVNFDVPVYYKRYLVKDKIKYYLIPFDGQEKKSESIKSFRADYPGGLEHISLKITENPGFELKNGKRTVSWNGDQFTLNFNRNLVEYYQTYPDCDLKIYFPPPLSSTALKSINAQMDELKGNSSQKQVNTLLHFVQNAFGYRTDKDQFGYENYLFAEETLYYEYADCEDRTVLLAQLIGHFTDLNTIALAYPGHVTLAVNVEGVTEGSYVTYQGERYFVCDPTYIGSSCGMLMPELGKEKPELIVY